MTLETYRKKRDFTATAEPKGRARRKPAVATKSASFVIQKHAARRLHYDLRLEMDGVLKSWAVTRGPSLIPGEKRLAVHVEDHPLEYGDFEGTIPKGSYGAGSVIVWDRGEWKPHFDPDKGYKKGHLEFELQGEKLSGAWHLVRMAGKRGEKRENWLLIKSDDEAARTAADEDILEERPESVKTGRTIEEVDGKRPLSQAKKKADGKKPPAELQSADKQRRLVSVAEIDGTKKANMPPFVEPSLATLSAKTPAGKNWLHEIKFDGYRVQAVIDGGKVSLLTRRGLDWTDRFGEELAAELISLPVEQAILDGEIVVEKPGGASDFSALQADLAEGRHDRFRYYLFDLLYLDGYDLRQVPLKARKTALEALIGQEVGLLRYSGHFEESGEIVLRHACRLSLEGLVSKASDQPYRSGRGKSWIKTKCSSRQEFVIAGYVPSTVSNKAIGSLILGVHENGKLVHVGRVGTGFNRKSASSLFNTLEERRIDKSPFAKKLTAEAARDARFVRPELVAEVEFRGWTGDGNLRHASFRGLREDKPAEEIVREVPATATAAEPEPAWRTVRLTHPDRLYWPDAGVTKAGLADYYAEVWPRIGPLIVNRPLALLRCPNGVDKACFFQKHAWKGLDRNIRQIKDPQEEGDEPLVAIDSLEGLLGLAQGATLEIHPWQTSLPHWEKPDMLVMDLDPGEGIEWSDIIAAAQEVGERLKAHGLNPFVKTSGGKGLHVVAPIKPRVGWDEFKEFAKSIASEMAKDSPDRYVATITKSKRRGKILVDYLRNGRGSTAVAAYSTRARAGAAVSMPVEWDELHEITSNQFTVENAPARIAAQARDPWADFFTAAEPVKATKGESRTKKA
jgi:bifunctional non-homologous end joining protein LigD